MEKAKNSLLFSLLAGKSASRGCSAAFAANQAVHAVT
jgi:hypothetical protein